MRSMNFEEVISVSHWTESLFSFKVSRASGFRFRSGQFTMIGMEVAGRPLLRAYSIASANHEEHLEFFSIKVPDGPLTSRLQHLQTGDKILVNSKPTGTLVTDNLTGGRNLYLMATGTGLAPFLSIIKDPETYERFEKVVLVHGCREVAELAYRDLIQQELPSHEYLGEMVSSKLIYYPTVTREPFPNRGRLTEIISSNDWYTEIGTHPLTAEHDRIMMCGSPAMLRDLVVILSERRFREGNYSEPGEYVIERAFVEK
jgi:ferredoxin/flavodoxin---NADP+ reductase